MSYPLKQPCLPLITAKGKHPWTQEKALLSGLANRRPQKRLPLSSTSLKAPESPSRPTLPSDLCQPPAWIITVICCFCVRLPTLPGKSWVPAGCTSDSCSPTQQGLLYCLEIPCFPDQMQWVAHFSLWLFQILSAFFKLTIFNIPIMPTAKHLPFSLLTYSVLLHLVSTHPFCFAWS